MDQVSVNPADPTLLIAIGGLQLLWGLFMGLLAWTMNRVLKDIERNTEATTKVSEKLGELNLLVTANYLPVSIYKDDRHRFEERLRGSENEILALKTREEYREKLAIAGKSGG